MMIDTTTFEEFSDYFNQSELTRYRFSESGKRALYEYLIKNFCDLDYESDLYDIFDLCDDFIEYESLNLLLERNRYLLDDSDLQGLILDGSIIDVGNGRYLLRTF